MSRDRELSLHPSVIALPELMGGNRGHHVTSLDDYLRAEARDRTEPASFYVPGAEGWGDYKAKRRAFREAHVAEHYTPEDDEVPTDASLFDDPEALYDLTEGGYAASSLHPLED